MTLPTARQIQQAFEDLHRFEAERVDAGKLTARGMQIASMLVTAPHLRGAIDDLKSTSAIALHIDDKYTAVLEGLIMGILALGINLGARATEIRLDAHE